MTDEVQIALIAAVAGAVTSTVASVCSVLLAWLAHGKSSQALEQGKKTADAVAKDIEATEMAAQAASTAATAASTAAVEAKVASGKLDQAHNSVMQRLGIIDSEMRKAIERVSEQERSSVNRKQ